MILVLVSVSEPRSPAESGTHFIKPSSVTNVLCVDWTKAVVCLYMMLQCVHITLLKCLQSLAEASALPLYISQGCFSLTLDHIR